MSYYYTLIAVDGEELVEKAKYTNGKKAAKIASRLSRRTGRKYQVRKIDETVGNPDWQNREMDRFTNGEYQPLHSYLRGIAPIKHYAHVAKKDPNLIAYTKDELKGREDKQSLATIEAYIELCLKHPDTIRLLTALATDRGMTLEYFMTTRYDGMWRENVINAQREYAQTFTQTVQFAGPVTDPEDDDEIERVADAIEEVYTNCAPGASAVGGSCMRYTVDDERYSAKVNKERVHPTIAYASPDLAIAYLVDTKGRTTARALCWPEKKVYGRMYADNDALHNALKALGYTKCMTYYGYNGGKTSLVGARVRKITNDRRGFVMPYIDGDHSVSDHDDKWFSLYGGDYRAESTDGVIYADPKSECESCGYETDEDDMTRVYTCSGRTQYENWCPSCVDSHTFYCNGYDVYFADNCVDSVEVDGQTYSLRYAENNANYCEYIEGYTFDRTYVVYVSEYGEVQKWGKESVEQYAVKIDGKYYSTDHLDTCPVVTERHVPNTPSKWMGSPTYQYRFTGVVYYEDVTMDYPSFLIDAGEVNVYKGVDGKYYLRDYIDHYPVARERVAEDGPVTQSWAHSYIGQPVWYDETAGVKEAEALRLILEDEAKRAQMHDDAHSVLMAAQ